VEAELRDVDKRGVRSNEAKEGEFHWGSRSTPQHTVEGNPLARQRNGQVAAMSACPKT